MASPLGQDDSTASGYSTDSDTHHRKNNDKIACSIQAIVNWTGDGGRSEYLGHAAQDSSSCGHLTLDLHFDGLGRPHTGLVRLRSNIALKNKREKTNVFLFIYPERIRTLALVEDAATEFQSEAREKLGTITHCLRFSLRQTASFIAPKDDLTPKNNPSKLVMRKMQALARETTFDVYFPQRAMLKAQVIIFCEEASSGSLHTLQRIANVARLYNGKGGKVIEQGDVVERGTEAAGTGVQDVLGDHESPPSYKDVAADAPPPELPPQMLDQCPDPATRPRGSRKRQRSISDTDTTERTSIEDMLITLRGCMEAGFRELSTRMTGLEQRVGGIETQLRQSSSRQQGTGFIRQAAELRCEFERDMHDLRKEVSDTINVRVEDELYVVQKNLEQYTEEKVIEHVEDYLADELSGIEESVAENIKDRLSNATVSADLRIHDL